MSTSNRNKTTEQNLTDSCWEILQEGLQLQLTILLVLNIFLAIVTILGNTLILVALHHESSLYPPSKLLLRGLAASDLCVGLIFQPICGAFWISILVKNWTLCRYSKVLRFILGYLLGSVSLLTLTAISVDRLLALLLKLRYRHVVTLKRTSLILVLIWVLSTFAAVISRWNGSITTWYGYIGISLCLVLSSFSYSTIFWRLRQHQTQPQVQTNETSPLNITRYKRVVASALWLQLALITCYLPYQITDIIYNLNDLTPSVFLAAQYSIILIYLNSALNPIFYCWKIAEVRQALKDTLRKLCY
ncbi:adenosine receptor A3-like [Stylophora pistillata]|uniref:adenosine receptor A3-like n=1 Tax=Stylophora pistillata TaxID=50429 RepID=UPI000C044584|nr:adenosine receptor A3-like [Stylophora pistillata]